ncbi:MAG: hypothetical protein SW833_17240 [Cyanobacteriota bacterium]|nr:hypothetical protein [Cyanobacteriota bacterium]
MVSTPKSVPQLIRETPPDAPTGRQPVRLLLCGVPKGVERVVHRLHVLGFAEVGQWTPPLPSPVEGEIIRVLTRYYTFK